MTNYDTVQTPSSNAGSVALRILGRVAAVLVAIGIKVAIRENPEVAPFVLLVLAGIFVAWFISSRKK